MILYLLWVLFVAISFIGWGALASKALRLDVDQCNFAYKLVIGISISAAIAAVIMLAGIGSPPIWIGLLTIGAIASLLFSFGEISLALKQSNREAIKRWIISVTLIFLVVLIGVMYGIVRGWNGCDDDSSYLYLARRLWLIGDLAEPFHNRRLTSPGLFTFIQATVMGPFKEGTLNFADEVLGAVLILISLWRRPGEKKFFRVGIITALIVVISHQVLGGGNSSPVLFVFAVLMTILPRLDDVPRTPIQARFEGVLLGAGSAVLILSRPYFLPIIAMTVAALIFGYRKIASFIFIKWTILTAALVSAPWFVLGIRDVGTPLFPLLKGNLAANFPFEGYLDQVDVGSTIQDSLQALGNSSWPLVVIFVAMAYFAVEVTNRNSSWKRSADAKFYISLVLGAAAYFVWFSVSVRRTGSAVSFPRFWSPMLSILSVVLVKKIQQSNSDLLSGKLYLSIIAPLLLFYPTLNGIWTTTSTGVRVISSGEASRSIQSDRFVGVNDAYKKLSDEIPTGAHVLFAVDLPHLLLSDRYTGVSIDLPGSTVEEDDFPFFASTQAKTKWLQQNNFDFVAVTSSSASSCLFNRAAWASNAGKSNAYGDWQPFVEDWIKFADELSAESASLIYTIGSLSLVDINSFNRIK